MKKISEFFSKLTLKFLSLVQSPLWLFTVPLVLLLGFIPVRVSTLFFSDPEIKILLWCFGFLLVCRLWVFQEDLLSRWLNSQTVQTLMFVCLKFEDLIWSVQGFKGFVQLLGFFICVVETPAIFLDLLGLNPYLWYWALMILLGTYYRLRTLFIFPNKAHVDALRDDEYMKPIQNSDEFTWNFIIDNMNRVSNRLHKRGVTNRLGSAILKSPFPHAGFRYIFQFNLSGERFGQAAVELFDKNGRLVFTSLITAGLLSFGCYGYLQNKELDIKAQEQQDNFELGKQQNVIAEYQAIIAARKQECDSRLAAAQVLRETRAEFSPDSAEYKEITKQISTTLEPISNLETVAMLTTGPKLHMVEKDPTVIHSVYEQPGLIQMALKKVWICVEPLFF